MRKLISVRFHESVHLGINGQTNSVAASKVHRLEYLPDEELVLIQVKPEDNIRLVPLHGNIAEMVAEAPKEAPRPAPVPVLDVPTRPIEMPAEIAAALSGNHKKK